MTGKTEVYRVVYNDGKNRNALVFQKPVEGLSFQQDQMVVFGDNGQSSFAAVNDEGNIPHMEPSGGADENLGVTWHFAK